MNQLILMQLYLPAPAKRTLEPSRCDNDFSYYILQGEEREVSKSKSWKMLSKCTLPGGAQGTPGS